MTTTIFLTIFLTLTFLEFITVYTLKVLNMNSVLKNRFEIPSFFKDFISNDDYKKSINYSLKKEKFSLMKNTVSLILILLILFSGLLGHLEQFVSSLGFNSYLTGLLFIGSVSLLMFIISLPFGLYSTFVLEEEFGFNKMTFKGYFQDLIKQGVISIILGSILLVAIFFFIDKTMDLWWLWASIFFVAFQLFILIIYPTVIAPIFNKFTPLEDGELKDRLEELAKKTNFPIKGIFVMDGSKRSGHSNAYFTGFGKSRRVVLYDTLIESLSVDELHGVLAHEIGHWKKGHIKKRMFLSFVTMPVIFFILSLALNFIPLFEIFSMTPGTSYGLLVLISLVSTSFTFFISPFTNFLSRKDEFEADKYAQEIIGTGEPLKNALLNLSKENLSNLTPHPAYSTYYYSHPPVSERVKKIQD